MGLFGQLGAIAMDDKWQVGIAGGGQVKAALQKDLASGIVEQVGTPDDVSDALLGIIHDDSQLVGIVPIPPFQDEVTDSVGNFFLLPPEYTVSKAHKTRWDSQPNGGIGSW